MHIRCLITIGWLNNVSKNNFISRDFVMGTTVALVVISSSAEVDPSFEEHLKSTVIGNFVDILKL
jgi:hypothetical protein